MRTLTPSQPGRVRSFRQTAAPIPPPQHWRKSRHHQGPHARRTIPVRTSIFPRISISMVLYLRRICRSRSYAWHLACQAEASQMPIMRTLTPSQPGRARSCRQTAAPTPPQRWRKARHHQDVLRSCHTAAIMWSKFASDAHGIPKSHYRNSNHSKIGP